MRKNPVLGLVGLCVGLVLSGCSGDGGRRSSRKDADAVPKAQKGQTSSAGSWTDRRRSVADQGVASRGGDPARVQQKPYDYPKESYSVPKPTDEGMVKKPSRPVVSEQDEAGIDRKDYASQGLEEPATVPESKKPTSTVYSVPPPPPATGAVGSKEPLATPFKSQQEKLEELKKRIMEEPPPLKGNLAPVSDTESALPPPTKTTPAVATKEEPKAKPTQPPGAMPEMTLEPKGPPSGLPEPTVTTPPNPAAPTSDGPDIGDSPTLTPPGGK